MNRETSKDTKHEHLVVVSAPVSARSRDEEQQQQQRGVIASLESAEVVQEAAADRRTDNNKRGSPRLLCWIHYREKGMGKWWMTHSVVE